jgi:hypothetical protein
VDNHGKATVKVWDRTGHILFTEDVALAPPITPLFNGKKVELSRDGTRVAYHGWEPGEGDVKKAIGRTRVWDVATGREVFRRDTKVRVSHS